MTQQAADTAPTLEDVTQAVRAIFDDAATTGGIKQMLLDGFKGLKEREWEAALRNFGGAHVRSKAFAKKAPALGEALRDVWVQAATYAIGEAEHQVVAGQAEHAARILAFVEELAPYGSEVKARAAATLADLKRGGEDPAYAALERDALERLRTDRDDPAAAVQPVHDAALATPLGSMRRIRLGALRAKLLTFAIKRASQLGAGGEAARAHATLCSVRRFTAEHRDLALLIAEKLRALEAAKPELAPTTAAPDGDGDLEDIGAG